MSSPISPAFQRYPTVLQKAEVPPWNGADEVFDTTYSTFKSEEWRPLVIGEMKRNLFSTRTMAERHSPILASDKAIRGRLNPLRHFLISGGTVYSRLSAVDSSYIRNSCTATGKSPWLWLCCRRVYCRLDISCCKLSLHEDLCLLSIEPPG